MKNVKALGLLLACTLACTGAVYGEETAEYTVAGTETQDESDVTGTEEQA